MINDASAGQRGRDNSAQCFDKEKKEHGRAVGTAQAFGATLKVQPDMMPSGP